ncbi:penicillin-binding protein activator [Chelativorans sp. AA-79]|uniref:penicillin-binding protein activator n=1 Tax=Chelativorans sp. AA-79 TaxID=3028735 RepID=UPI0023F78780|nr:penicillin-binding protein activator [Chelativorans sp. AA-79]WEX09348.1 penicillin-binding protein activator [Chelativorans sp. AA-79]
MHLACARRAGTITVAALAAFLSACSTQQVPSGLPSRQPAATARPAANTVPAQGEIIGSGETRVALLVPLSAEGNGGTVAGEIRNAARLALEDAGLDTLQIVVKDTGGTEPGASAAAASAVSEGAAMILGPLFAANVRAASVALGPAHPPTLAFSSDRSAAGPGTYLNSFLPGDLVRRIIAYAASQGVRRVVALVPNGPAGQLAEAEARRVLQASGGEVVAVGRYGYDNASMMAALQEVALSISDADAIFIPDGGNTPSVIAAALKGMGIDLSGKRLLGNGQWTSANLSDPALQGGWFADVDHARLNIFKGRYQQRFGAEPSVTASLAYDSVILASALARQGGAAAFTPAYLQTVSGFAGTTGTFRFLPDGTNERGYAVYEVTDGAARLISPAPASFTGGS